MDADEITVQEGKELVKLARTSVESFVKNRKLVTSIDHNRKSLEFLLLYIISMSRINKKICEDVLAMYSHQRTFMIL